MNKIVDNSDNGRFQSNGDGYRIIDTKTGTVYFYDGGVPKKRLLNEKPKPCN